MLIGKISLGITPGIKKIRQKSSLDHSAASRVKTSWTTLYKLRARCGIHGGLGKCKMKQKFWEKIVNLLGVVFHAILHKNYIWYQERGDCSSNKGTHKGLKYSTRSCLTDNIYSDLL